MINYHLIKQIEKKVYDQTYILICDHVWNSIGKQLRNNVTHKLSNHIQSKLVYPITTPVVEHVKYKIKKQF